jgi:hypothetical protein
MARCRDLPTDVGDWIEVRARGSIAGSVDGSAGDDPGCASGWVGGGDVVVVAVVVQDRRVVVDSGGGEGDVDDARGSAGAGGLKGCADVED